MNGFPLHAGKDALPAGPDPAEHAAYVRTTDPEADLSTFDGAVLLYQGRLTRSAYVPCPPPPGVGARRPAPGRAPGPQIRPVRWIRPRRPGRRPRRRATRRSRHPADHHRRHRRFPPAQPPARRPCRMHERPARRRSLPPLPAARSDGLTIARAHPAPDRSAGHVRRIVHERAGLDHGRPVPGDDCRSLPVRGGRHLGRRHGGRRGSSPWAAAVRSPSPPSWPSRTPSSTAARAGTRRTPSTPFTSHWRQRYRHFTPPPRHR